MQKKVSTATDIKLVSWPSPQDYNEAIQNPQLNFGDPELRKGQLALSPLGLPRPITGHFASVYRVHCGRKDWAVRCFLQNHPDQQQRYMHIADHLSRTKLESSLDFDYQPQGICVGKTWYPILKMQWCYGESLNAYIDRNRFNRRALERLADSFKKLVYDLKTNDIAHGDLQHGNIIVENEKLKLVDYDGMFVPSLASFQSHELGHRSYQHPGRKATHFGAYLDYFPAWLIYLSLQTLTYAPELWLRFDGGDECILLSQADLEQPATSRAFYDMERHANEEVRKNSRLIRYLLSLPIEDVPVPDFDAPQPAPASLPPVNPAARQSTVVLDYDDDESYGYDYDDEVLILPPSFKKGARKKRGRQKSPIPKPSMGQQIQTAQSTLPTWMQKGQPASGSRVRTSTGSGTQPSVNPSQARQTTLNNLIAGRPVLHGVPKTQREATIQMILLFLSFTLFLFLLARSLLQEINSPPTVSNSLSKIADTIGSAPAVTYKRFYVGSQVPLEVGDTIGSAPAVTYNDKGESNLLTAGNLYYKQGKYEEARKSYLDLTAYFLEDNSLVSYQNLAAAYNNLGILEVRQGNFDAGQSYFSESIKFWKYHQKRSPDSYVYAGHALAEFNLGLSMQMQSDLAQAGKQFEKARDLYFMADTLSGKIESYAQQIKKCNDQIKETSRLSEQSGL